MGAYLKNDLVIDCCVISLGFMRKECISMSVLDSYNPSGWLRSLILTPVTNFMTDTNFRVMVF